MAELRLKPEAEKAVKEYLEGKRKASGLPSGVRPAKKGEQLKNAVSETPQQKKAAEIREAMKVSQASSRQAPKQSQPRAVISAKAKAYKPKTIAEEFYIWARRQRPKAAWSLVEAQASANPIKWGKATGHLMLSGVANTAADIYDIVSMVGYKSRQRKADIETAQAMGGLATRRAETVYPGFVAVETASTMTATTAAENAILARQLTSPVKIAQEASIETTPASMTSKGIAQQYWFTGRGKVSKGFVSQSYELTGRGVATERAALSVSGTESGGVLKPSASAARVETFIEGEKRAVRAFRGLSVGEQGFEAAGVTAVEKSTGQTATRFGIRGFEGFDIGAGTSKTRVTRVVAVEDVFMVAGKGNGRKLVSGLEAGEARLQASIAQDVAKKGAEKAISSISKAESKFISNVKTATGITSSAVITRRITTTGAFGAQAASQAARQRRVQSSPAGPVERNRLGVEAGKAIERQARRITGEQAISHGAVQTIAKAQKTFTLTSQTTTALPGFKSAEKAKVGEAKLSKISTAGLGISLPSAPEMPSFGIGGITIFDSKPARKAKKKAKLIKAKAAAKYVPSVEAIVFGIKAKGKKAKRLKKKAFTGLEIRPVVPGWSR